MAAINIEYSYNIKKFPKQWRDFGALILKTYPNVNVAARTIDDYTFVQYTIDTSNEDGCKHSVFFYLVGNVMDATYIRTPKYERRARTWQIKKFTMEELKELDASVIAELL